MWKGTLHLRGSNATETTSTLASASKTFRPTVICITVARTHERAPEVASALSALCDVADPNQLARTYTQPDSCAFTAAKTPEGCSVTPGRKFAIASLRTSSTVWPDFDATFCEKNCSATLQASTTPPLAMKFGSANASNIGAISLRVDDSSAGLM